MRIQTLARTKDTGQEVRPHAMDRDWSGGCSSILEDRLQGGRGDAPRPVWMEEMRKEEYYGIRGENDSPGI